MQFIVSKSFGGTEMRSGSGNATASIGFSLFRDSSSSATGICLVMSLR